MWKLQFSLNSIPYSREPTESANQQIQNNRRDGTIHTFSTTSRTESKIQNITDLQNADNGESLDHGDVGSVNVKCDD